jgi:hypothetical protein
MSALDQALAAMIDRLPITNFMPPSGQEFRKTSSVIIPAVGASGVVVQLKVPQGYNGMLKSLANVYIGGGFTDFGGLIVWQLYIDYQVGGGIVAPNFENITASLGSASNPARLHGIPIKENQLVTLLVKNVAPGVVPAGQTIGGLLGGYFYPVSEEPAQSF